MITPILLLLESIPQSWELSQTFGRDEALSMLRARVDRALGPLGGRTRAPLVVGNRWGFVLELPDAEAPARLEELVRETMEQAAETELVKRGRSREAMDVRTDFTTETLTRIAWRAGLDGVVGRAGTEPETRFVYTPRREPGEVLQLGTTVEQAIITLHRVRNPRWPLRAEAPDALGESAKA